MPRLLSYNWFLNQLSEHAEDDSLNIILSDAGAIYVTYGQLQLCPHLTLSHPGDHDYDSRLNPPPGALVAQCYLV